MSKRTATVGNKLTNEQVLGLLAGHRALADGGNETVVQDGDKKRVVREIYKLGEARLPIVQNITLLAAAAEDYHNARNAVIRELSNGGNEVPKDKEAEFFVTEANLLKKEIELPVRNLTRASLKIGQNELPGSLLQLLTPILSD